MPAKSKKIVPVAPPAPVQIEPEIAVAPARTPLFGPLSLDSLADLGCDNFAAMTKANLALSEGLKAIGDQIFAYATTSLETAGQTATALLGAKTLDEVIQLNNELAKSTLGILAERSAKLSEMSVTLASETFAPLGGRMEATLNRFARAAAA